MNRTPIVQTEEIQIRRSGRGSFIYMRFDGDITTMDSGVRRWNSSRPEPAKNTRQRHRFARHARSRGKLGMDTCFVYPYSSWRRGNNGNRNGVVRRQLPKRCEIRMDMVRGLREIVDEPLESQGQQGRCTSK